MTYDEILTITNNNTSLPFVMEQSSIYNNMQNTVNADVLRLSKYHKNDIVYDTISFIEGNRGTSMNKYDKIVSWKKIRLP